MRIYRLLICLTVAFTLSAVVAASAVASPEFHAATYPAKIEAQQLNNQGFSPSNAEFTSSCEVLEAKTKEEAGKPLEAKDLTADSPTLRVHPKYEKCILTVLGSASGTAIVNTEGCYYKFHAATPGTPAGTVDIECEAGKAIKIVALFLAGCEITFKPQSALGTLEYKNQPPGQEVELAAELSKVKTQISPSCGTGKVENLSEYRETEVMGGNAKLAPSGHPAKLQFKGREVPLDPIEILANEPHWYENHSPLGTGEAAAEQAVMWGKLVLTDAGSGIGSAECQTEWGGNVYNPQGASSSAGPGEAKIDAFQAYNCTSTVCEATDKSKLSVEPEGLGVSGLSTLAWEGKLSGPPTRLKFGNKTSGSPTQIKWHVVCPKTTGAEYNKKWKGELAPELENGTAIGSAPSKLTFNSGELEVEAVTEGKVSNKLKLMGYEGGEIISTKSP